MENDVKSQGFLGNLLLDEETINKFKLIINAIDPDKIKMILDSMSKDDQGWINIRINLRLKI